MKNSLSKKEIWTYAYYGAKSNKSKITMKTIKLFCTLLVMCLFTEGLYAQQPVTVSSKISHSHQDAEENIWTGSINLGSPDLDLLFDGADEHEARAGMHFTGLNIPAGATVQNAYIQFSADEIDSGYVSILIYGEAANDPAIWTTASQNISSRAKTTASVKWSPPNWLVEHERLSAQQTPALSTIIQEILDRPGYATTDAINIIMKMITDNERRVAESYNGSATHAPELFVTYVETTNDTAAPNIPAGLTVDSFNHNSANISWDVTSDNGGGTVNGYYIYNNGTQIKEVTGGTSTVLTGLIPETPYQLSIAAYDDASPTPNISNPSPTVSFTTEAANNPSTPAGDLWQTYNDIDAFLPTGNVGIGTEPQSLYRLAVDGKIHTKEVLVNETGWADYVFTKDYNLPTLKEVQKHIDEKGHLINIPSAAEVEANGFELGQMNKLLLEKIEELTLYILEQERRIKNLEKK